MKKVLIGLGVLVVVLAVGLPLLVLALNYEPAPVEEVAADCRGAQATLRVGEPVTVVSWNLQYAASREQQFWYDDGDAVFPAADAVARTLEALAAGLDTMNPDIALLQEVDRDSRRTGRIDQLPAYAATFDAPCAITAPYHRSAFVPTPGPTEFLGRVDMHLATLSRFPLTHATRTQLPMLQESALRRAFNLKRALLVAEIPVEGLDQPLAVATTHLSAFSRGDGTLERQVAVLSEWMAARPAGQPWVLAGDFNLLPPGDDPSRLGKDAGLYADSVNPVARLLQEQREVFSDPLAPESRTYLPFGADEPDRKIDYLFVGGPLNLRSARVAMEYGSLSDHLPIVVTFTLGDSAPEAPEPEQPEGEAPAVE